MPYDAFISHASEDALFAFAVCRDLEANGMQCWIAIRDQRGDKPYAEQIVEAIDAAACIVVVLSRPAIASANVAREVQHAAETCTTIVVARRDQTALRGALAFFLRRIDHLEADAGALVSIFDRISERVSSIAHAAPLEEVVKPETFGKRPILGSSLAAFLAWISRRD